MAVPEDIQIHLEPERPLHHKLLMAPCSLLVGAGTRGVYVLGY